MRREFDFLTLTQLSESTQIKPAPVQLITGTTQIFGHYELQLFRHLSREKWPHPVSPEQIRASGELAIVPPSAMIAELSESVKLDALILRARNPGDRYIPVNSRHETKLKTLMIRNKIPFSERETHPVLISADERILWSPGLPVARDFSPLGQEDEFALIIAQKVCME